MNSTPAPVRTEGLAERVGDILISCSGSTPGAVISGNLTVAFPAAVTNRVDSSNLTTDAVLAADLGGGFVQLPVTAQVNGNTLFFNGMNLTVPPNGTYSVRVSGVRLAVSQLGFSSVPVRAQLVFGGTPWILNQAQVIVAVAQQALFATLYNRGAITCVGSPTPSSITVPNLFSAGTFFVSNRVSEGFATAFAAKSTGEDSGTRFVLQFSGFPAGTRVFVPDYVAGSSATTPTAGGDLGVPQSSGVYTPGDASLLLGRVSGSDSSGAGGFVFAPAGAGPISLTGASEVLLPGGSGVALYEVLNANPNLRESAQIPVFVSAPEGTGPATAQESLSLGPLSSVAVASSSAPIPRFTGSFPAGDDCTLLGDCSSGFFPKLTVNFQPIRFTAIAGGATNELWGSILIDNSGSGLMPWTATVQYADGKGWAFLDYTSGVKNATVRVTADPKGLAAGTYRATVLIDAGPKAGSASVPVTLTVSPAPSAPTPPPAPAVTISKIVNAATFEPTPLAAGSLGTAIGSNLAGKSVSVSLDGVNAEVLYASATQINFVVPAAMRGKSSASLIVTVDGVKSAAQAVVLASSWPSIFAHGVLNQDYSQNGPEVPAAAGSVFQIFATGIGEGATVSVQMGDRRDLVPLYAGAAPALPGVQQVNVAAPEGVTGSVPLTVCAVSGSQSFCSAAYTVVVR